eukprot:TRINITY_DN15937_c0_g1_i3.p1 TRINITY_DN15937_c0_g1~~TRINITY_DN15937_c0_g1_i3.p1  ORF type:complete len:635 (-),score=73.42 TRINITY_DN15937_c0_g1_i3:107-2011(-)
MATVSRRGSDLSVASESHVARRESRPAEMHVTGMHLPVCDMGFGSLSCLMSFTQPFGFCHKDDEDDDVPTGELLDKEFNDVSVNTFNEDVIASRSDSLRASKTTAPARKRANLSELCKDCGNTGIDFTGQPCASCDCGQKAQETNDDLNDSVPEDRSNHAEPMTQKASSKLRRLTSTSRMRDFYTEMLGEGENKGSTLSSQASSSSSRKRDLWRQKNGPGKLTKALAMAADGDITPKEAPPLPHGFSDPTLAKRASANSRLGRTLSLAVQGVTSADSILSTSATSVLSDGDFEPVALALRMGRWVEAYRRLRELELMGSDPLKAFSPSMVERIRRIGSRFEASVRDFHDDNAWTKAHDSASGLDFAYRLSNSTFQIVTSTVYTGIDALQAFVTLCEYDLCSRYCADVVGLEPLRERFYDSLWRVRKTGQNGNEDNVLHVSCLDALDEPLGALWVCAYTPEDSWKDASVSIPDPKEGSVRVGLWRMTFAVEPVWPQSNSNVDVSNVGSESSHAFKLTVSLCRRPTSAACMFPEVVMRREVATVMDRFHAFLKDNNELNWRILFSRRAPFYDEVRRHLSVNAPPTARQLASPLLQLTFQDISEFLPEGWADDTAGFASDGAAKSIPSLDRSNEVPI